MPCAKPYSTSPGRHPNRPQPDPPADTSRGGGHASIPSGSKNHGSILPVNLDGPMLPSGYRPRQGGQEVTHDRQQVEPLLHARRPVAPPNRHRVVAKRTNTPRTGRAPTGRPGDHAVTHQTRVRSTGGHAHGPVAGPLGLGGDNASVSLRRGSVSADWRVVQHTERISRSEMDDTTSGPIQSV